MPKGAHKCKPAKHSKVAAKSTQPKSKGKQTGASWGSDDLYAQLRCIGLRVQQVDGDGNCLFRAVSDQTEGHEGLHAELRRQAMQYIREHQEDFEPFVEDDEPFVQYCRRMEEEGTWGGNLELQALSLLLKVNITVHQAGQPPWTLQNHAAPGTKLLHLSYHGQDHYNSVRRTDDPLTGPPLPVNAQGVAAAAAKAAIGQWEDDLVTRVQQGSGFWDKHKTIEALDACNGNMDEAIEWLVEQEAARAGVGACEEAQEATAVRAEDATAMGVGHSQQDSVAEECAIDAAHCSGAGNNVHVPTATAGEVSNNLVDTCAGGGMATPTSSTQRVPAKGREKRGKGVQHTSASDHGKHVSRNKACPCGSGKKFKNCCRPVQAAAVRRGGTGQPSASYTDGDVAKLQTVLQEMILI